jgi:hypothetical protein
MFLILELTFTFIIPASQFPYYYYDQNDRILRYATTEQREGVVTIGYLAQQRTRWRINKAGWNSDIDFGETKRNLRIAVIGDSYVEALQVNVGDSLAGQLRRMVSPEIEVYDFGISGAPLSQYLQMARYARAHFNPDILVVNVVHNDFDESLCSVKRTAGMLCLEVEGDSVREAPILPYQPNPVLRMARHVALFRYVTVNLKLIAWFQQAFVSNRTNAQYNANIDVQEVRSNESRIKQATDYVLKKLQLENEGKPVVFLIDAPRKDIYAGTLAHSNVLWLNELLRTKCREFGFDVIDLTEEFARLFEAHHVHFESEYDWHWNELGHKTAAGKLYDHLSARLRLRVAES